MIICAESESNRACPNWPSPYDTRPGFNDLANLRVADQAVQQSGRNALREMRGEMVRGTFPVARG